MLKFIKNNLYALLFLAILLGACFGGYKYYRSQKAAKTETVKTASVEYGNLQKSVSATGSLTALGGGERSRHCRPAAAASG